MENGRLVLDEPTNLPNGTVLELVVDDEGDNLDDAERAALHAAISKGWAQFEAGQGRPVEEVLAERHDRR